MYFLKNIKIFIRKNIKELAKIKKMNLLLKKIYFHYCINLLSYEVHILTKKRIYISAHDACFNFLFLLVIIPTLSKEELNEADTSSVEAMSHPLDLSQPTRKDEVTEENQRDELLKNAPSVKSGLFIVPKVIDGEA